MGVWGCIGRCIEQFGGDLLPQCARGCVALERPMPSSLAELAEYACEKGTVTIAEAAKRFGWRPSTAKKYLIELAKLGLLTRLYMDGRSYYVCSYEAL